MAIVDNDGRLFGRVNLVDLAIVLFAFALVPLAYGSWILFRTPLPVVTSIHPAVVGADEQTVLVEGQHLRPYLRAFVGAAQAVYLSETPDRAEVRLPRLAPGTYDLVFFDDWQEVYRGPGALTVRADMVAVIVRYAVRQEVMNTVASELERQRPVGASEEGLVSLEVVDQATGTSMIERLQGRFSIVHAVIRLQAVRTAEGWRYQDQVLRAGAQFNWKTPTYQLNSGEILRVDVSQAREQ